MTDSPAFDEAYAPLFSQAVQVGERITGNRRLAEDVAVETLARARLGWRRVHREPDAWVLRESAERALRAGRKLPGLDAIYDLSRRQRRAVTLCDLVELDPAVAADILGWRRWTVVRRRRRAARRLGWR